MLIVYMDFEPLLIAVLTPLLFPKYPSQYVFDLLTYYCASALCGVYRAARLGWWVSFHLGSPIWQPRWVWAGGWGFRWPVGQGPSLLSTWVSL